MLYRSLLVMLLLANALPSAFAATGSETPMAPGTAPAASTVASTAAEQVPAEQQEPAAATIEQPVPAVSGDAGAQLQFVQPLPGPATTPPDVAEPPSCIPHRSAEMRRGFVRLLAEVARAVVR